MRIWERYPGSWYIEYQHKGKRIQQKIGRTKSEAMAEQKKLRMALRSPITFEKHKTSPTLFESLVCEYLTHSELNKTSRTHQNECKRINRHWLPEFRGLYLDEITPLMIEHWKGKRVQSGITMRTIRNDLEVLRTMFARAIDWGLFSGKNPVGKLPKIFQSEVKIYTAEDAQKYLAACGKSLFPIAATLIYTGMRPIELINLKRSDIDFARQIITIQPTSSKKNVRGRVIPIHPALADVLASQLESHSDDQVFPGRHGGLRGHFRCAHCAARIKAGLPHLRLYDFRHMFASLLLAEGTDPAAVVELMGHGGLEITMRIYHHLHPDRARRVINTLPNIVSPFQIPSNSSSDKNELNKINKIA